MSEFRKYRLVSKLLDGFGLTADPTPYVRLLGEENLSPGNPQLTQEMLERLISQSQDPARFREILLQTKGPEVEGLLRVLVWLQENKPRKEEDHFQAFSKSFGQSLEKLEALQPSFSSSSSSSSSSSDVTEELENLATKLSTISHRIANVGGITAARIDRVIVPIRPFEDFEEGSSDFLRLLPFRNEASVRLGQYVSSTEYFVIDDLLHALLGVSGSFFTFPGDSETDLYTVYYDDSISTALLQLCKPILRLAICYRGLDKFLRETAADLVIKDQGRVFQAMAACLEGLVQEYRQFLGQLEMKFQSPDTGGLHQFSYYLAPYAKRLQILYHLVEQIRSGGIYGGGLLRFIEGKLASHSGDPAVRTVLQELLIGSSRPFLQMLAEWIRDGRVNETKCEFMFNTIERKDLGNPDLDGVLNQWTLCKEQTPLMLTELTDQLWRLGAYRRIQLAMGTGDLAIPSVSLAWDKSRIVNVVMDQLAQLNTCLLGQVLAVEGSKSLLPWLLLAKRLFFVEQIDFGYALLEACRPELSKNIGLVSVEAVQAGLESAIHTTSMREVIGEDVRVFARVDGNCNLTDHLLRIIGGSSSTSPKDSMDSANLTGIEVFSLGLAVDSFPTSLLLGPQNLAKYELLFRYQLALLDLNRELTLLQQKRRQHSQGILLRRGLLLFCQAMRQYLCYEVFEPQWARLSLRLLQEKGTGSLDELVTLHQDYLDSCLRAALLTNAKLVQLVSMILNIGARFLALQHQPDDEKIAALQQAFAKYMRVFLEALHYYAARDCDHYLGHLLTRLDYNGYYHNQTGASKNAGMVY